MAKNSTKKKHLPLSIEDHKTSSLMSVNHLKPYSKVSIPNEFEVNNAKEYVDTNEK